MVIVRPILRPGSNCLDVCEVTKTGLLVDACDYYRAFYDGAKAARRHILISGWQFDSNVALLRGEDAARAGHEANFLSFLDGLCNDKKKLRIYILAWDFSMLYSLDREWFQEWYFNWTTNERLKFCFDCGDSFDSCHHQKFVVIDGKIAFLGGLDLCSGRWDERDHRADNPYRVNADKTPYKPFHDAQSYHVGRIAEKLTELFKARWQCIAGEELELKPRRMKSRIEFRNAVPVAAKKVAISRTQPHNQLNGEPIREIRRLFLDAIDAAEELIYIENQYFSSKALFNGIEARMRETSRPKLSIVLIIAKDAEAFLEQFSIGIVQTRVIRSLKEIALQTGHSVGIYYPASKGPTGGDVPTYIHSKIFLVDDRLLSVGSANMNNRSMGYDTELNVAWEASPQDTKLIETIREARANLLAEHTGMDLSCEELRKTKGLVDYLNRLADSGSTRLRHHPVESLSEQYHWMTTILPDGLPFDTEGVTYGEDVYEQSSEGNSFFSQGITSLKQWLLRVAEPEESHR